MNRRYFLKNSFFFLNAVLITNFLDSKVFSEVSYNRKLFTPTFITKIDGLFFVVDCWHHRIIYSKDINKDIKDWNILDDQIYGPHSIASNGSLYLADNTGNNSLRVYKKISDTKFEIIQNIEDLGIRPHKVLYSKKIEVFFAVISGKYGAGSTKNQNFYALQEKNGLLEIVYQTKLKELNDVYCRSITLGEKDLIYFISENSIIITKFENLKLSILDKIELPQELRDLNDLYYLDDDNILITLTNYSRKPKAIILKSFSDIIKGNYIDISDKFIGSPYYINKFDDYFWIPEVKNRSRICKYKFDRNELSLDKVVFDFKNHEEANIKRKSMYPL